MLDPENMTYVQWAMIVSAAALIVFFICRWMDLNIQY